MGFPSLNEMLNAIQASQQNAFIPAYQDALKQKQERDYKEQQMKKLMQEIQFTADMQPLEMESKKAATRNSNALAQNQENVAAKTAMQMNDPLYQPSISAGLQREISEADRAKHETVIKSSEANVAADKDMATRAFLQNPSVKTAIATDPKLMLDYEALLKGIEETKIRAANSGSGSSEKNPNYYSMVDKYTKLQKQAEDIYKQYAVWDAKANKWKAKDNTHLPLLNEALAQYELSKKMLDTLTATTTTTSNPFGLPPQAKTQIKGSASGNVPTQPQQPYKDAQGRIVIPD